MNWLSPIPENIPEDLKAKNQWVCWKAELKKDKWTKIPYNPKTNQKAKSNDPETWGSFAQAWKAFKAGGFGYTGIGFELSADDRFCGWDLDHCLEQEQWTLEPWAADIIQKLNSYTEISPSGTGIRIICKAILPPGRRKKEMLKYIRMGDF